MDKPKEQGCLILRYDSQAHQFFHAQKYGRKEPLRITALRLTLPVNCAYRQGWEVVYRQLYLLMELAELP